MVNRARKSYAFVRMERKNPKSKQQNEEVRATVERKEASLKDVSGAKGEIEKKWCMKIYHEKKKRATVSMCAF